MISAAVIAAALAFWAPYNGGQAPCGGELTVHDGDPAMVAGDGWPVDAYAPVMLGGCIVFVNRRYFNLQPPTQQCATLAHEIGHAFFALEHSADPANIMWPSTATRPIPPACAALTSDPSVKVAKCPLSSVAQPAKRDRQHGVSFFDEGDGVPVRCRRTPELAHCVHLRRQVVGELNVRRVPQQRIFHSRIIGHGLAGRDRCVSRAARRLYAAVPKRRGPR